VIRVRVLQVDASPANQDELRRGIAEGRTVDGWQMPKYSRRGDVAVWYATRPTKAFIAWGWIQDEPAPVPRDGGHGPYQGHVCGMQWLDEPVSRQHVIECCGIDGGHQGPRTIPDEKTAGFLSAVGLLSL
jgi:hypothetical protein